MTVELPPGQGGRSSSVKEPNGGSSGSTCKWNPMVPPPGVPIKVATVHLHQRMQDSANLSS